ncbi:cryptochrome/photolyase family protein, partial [Klebsiella pneumoniae]|uniref:cryptochrome/photolyase family protein n=1 Tax=Klebsiella pneumoniae TaxID=573 RepID=UPI003EE20E57
LEGEVNRAIKELKIEKIIVTQAADYHLQERINNFKFLFPISLEILPDDRFLSSIEEFKAWAKGKKQLRMEYFYREMRKKHQILIDSQG